MKQQVVFVGISRNAWVAALGFLGMVASVGIGYEPSLGSGHASPRGGGP